MALITGKVKLTPTATASAPSAAEGDLYYDSDKDQLMSSSSSAWRGIRSSQMDGLTEFTAGSSCFQIQHSNYSTGSKAYWILADGIARQTWCDMTTDGGGWTLVYKMEDTGGHGGNDQGEGYQSNVYDKRGTGLEAGPYNSGGGNLPGKGRIAADGMMLQRLMASGGTTVVWDYKGNLNKNLGLTEEGMSIHNSGGVSAIANSYDAAQTPDYSCTADGRGGGHSYGYDKASPGVCGSNCDGGWTTDCRWENTDSWTNHTQQTFHIFVK